MKKWKKYRTMPKIWKKYRTSVHTFSTLFVHLSHLFLHLCFTSRHQKTFGVLCFYIFPHLTNRRHLAHTCSTLCFYISCFTLIFTCVLHFWVAGFLTAAHKEIPNELGICPSRARCKTLGPHDAGVQVQLYLRSRSRHDGKGCPLGRSPKGTEVK